MFTRNTSSHYPFFKTEKNKAHKDKKYPLGHTANKGWTWDLSTCMSIFAPGLCAPLYREASISQCKVKSYL